MRKKVKTFLVWGSIGAYTFFLGTYVAQHLIQESPLSKTRLYQPSPVMSVANQNVTRVKQDPQIVRPNILESGNRNMFRVGQETQNQGFFRVDPLLKESVLNKIDNLFLSKDIKTITYYDVSNVIYQESLCFLSNSELRINQNQLLENYFHLDSVVTRYIKSRYIPNWSGFLTISTQATLEDSFSHLSPSGKNSVSVRTGFGTQTYLRIASSGNSLGRYQHIKPTKGLENNTWVTSAISYDGPSSSSLAGSVSTKREGLSLKTRATPLKTLTPTRPPLYDVKIEQVDLTGLQMITKTWDKQHFHQAWEELLTRAQSRASGVYIWETTNAFEEQEGLIIFFNSGIYVGKAFNFHERMSGEFEMLKIEKCPNELDQALFNLLYADVPEGQPQRELKLYFISADWLNRNELLCNALETLVLENIAYNRPDLVRGVIENSFYIAPDPDHGRLERSSVSFISNKAKNPAFPFFGDRSDWFDRNIIDFEQWEATHPRKPLRSRIPGRHHLNELIKNGVLTRHSINDDIFASYVLESDFSKLRIGESVTKIKPVFG